MSDVPVGGERPGDETQPGTKQAAEDICPRCNGSGRLEDRPYPERSGTGRITVIVGDA
jgi:hypothetical protein